MGGPDRIPDRLPTIGRLLLLVLGLFAAIVAAKIAGFLIAASGRAPDNLSLSTVWAARSSRWWSEPFVLIAPILYLPIATAFDWARSPGALLAALRRLRPAAVWIAPAVFLVGLVVLMTSDGGLLSFVLVGLAGLVLLGLATLYLFGLATRAGFPQPAFMLILAVLCGAASGALSGRPAATLACRAGSEISSRDGAKTPCAEILVFERREAHLVRRPDGAVSILPKADADRASLRAAVGPRSIWFDEIRPAD